MTRREDTNKIVKDVGKLAGVEIEDADISTSHRLPVNPKKQLPPSIIVKFSRRDVRNQLYSAKKKLSNKIVKDLGMTSSANHNKIYISESLTQRNRELFNKCLKARKDHQFKFFLWTTNGRILVRKDETYPATHIKDEKTLQAFIEQLKIDVNR